MYAIQTHRHRFALWAAARAAQRGLSGGRNEVLADALEASGIQKVVDDGERVWPTSSAAYLEMHDGWCSKLTAFLQKRKIALSYGRAAKLIAVYLKTTVVLGGQERSRFAKVL